jgi:hypothetical protein
MKKNKVQRNYKPKAPQGTPKKLSKADSALKAVKPTTIVYKGSLPVEGEECQTSLSGCLLGSMKLK